MHTAKRRQHGRPDREVARPVWLRCLSQGVAETIERGTHDPGEIGVLCEKHRRATETPLPIDVKLSEHVPDRDVIPHDLGGYDVE